MDVSLEALFTNDEYEQRTFTFGPNTVTLQCSASASTDYDLTGQILWPAAHLLASYLAASPRIMAGRRGACELGSGLGLVGVLCGQYCDTVLSDHNPVVLKVLQQNADQNQGQYRMRCQLADWERKEDIASLCELGPRKTGFPLVLAADICYGLKAITYIFTALATLLSTEQNSLGLLGYVSRAAAIDRGIFLEAAKAGLDLKEVPGTRQGVGGGLEGAIYAFTHTAGTQASTGRAAGRKKSIRPPERASWTLRLLLFCGAVVVGHAVLSGSRSRIRR